MQDDFWLEMSSVRWLFRKGSFKCSVIIPKILWATPIIPCCPMHRTWLQRERKFQSVRKFSISINSLAKVSRFTIQLSCHKSATATVSWKSRKSINTMLTGVTHHTPQHPHSRLNNSSEKFSQRLEFQSFGIHNIEYRTMKKWPSRGMKTKQVQDKTLLLSLCNQRAFNF